MKQPANTFTIHATHASPALCFSAHTVSAMHSFSRILPIQTSHHYDTFPYSLAQTLHLPHTICTHERGKEHLNSIKQKQTLSQCVYMPVFGLGHNYTHICLQAHHFYKQEKILLIFSGERYMCMVMWKGKVHQRLAALSYWPSPENENNGIFFTKQPQKCKSCLKTR